MKWLMKPVKDFYGTRIICSNCDSEYQRKDGQHFNYCPNCGSKSDWAKRGYWDNICDLQKKQTEKGIRNYGQTLEENDKLDMMERLTYLEEELIDGLMYIEHIKSVLS